MSVSFISALTGFHVGTLPFPFNSETTSLRCLLGRAVYFFRFIHDGAVILEHEVLRGDVEVLFLIEAVSFNIYLQNKFENKRWVVDTINVDLLSYWSVVNPIELMQRHSSTLTEDKPHLALGTFWRMWLQPHLNTGPVIHQQLAEMIHKDVVSISQIARRNILHEMKDQLRVDLFFSFHITNSLILRLLPIAGDFVVDDFSSCSVVMRSILEMYMA